MLVSRLSYEHRETTLGISSTWNAEPVRIHAILHATDLRAENIGFSTANGLESGQDQKDTFLNFGLGADYAARQNTLVIAGIRTAPQVTLRAETGELHVSRSSEYSLRMRFFPIPAIGFDELASIDEDALGLLDIEIGAGMHLVLGVD